MLPSLIEIQTIITNNLEYYICCFESIKRLFHLPGLTVSTTLVPTPETPTKQTSGNMITNTV